MGSRGSTFVVVIAAGVTALCAVGVAACGGTPECAVTAECGPGSICVDGTCLIDPAGSGEGEGSAAEGEGEGEGEGGAAEGEGGAGEGEGEGGAGEGEGEGQAACVPACGAFQTCNNGTCEFVGDVCDTFGNDTIAAFATKNATLDETTGVHFFFDGVERLERAYAVTGADATMQLQVTLTSTSTLDPILYVFDDSAGTCRQTGVNDDIASPTNLNSQLTVDFTAQTGAELVVTSFGNGTGSYTLQTRPLVCGLPTDSLATYDTCAGEALSQGCDHNPCVLPDPDGTTSGHFCCLSQSCRNGFGTGNVIKVVFDSNPAGQCHP